MPYQTLRRAQHPVERNVGHPGLRWDRFSPGFEDEKARDPYLKSFETFPAPELQAYRQVFAAWKRLLEERDAARAEWRAADRVCFGAGDKGMLEVGIRFHRTYGVPVIAGSAQKGLVLRYARRAGVPERTLDALFGLGGDQGQAAAVAFHDALWVPGSGGPFHVDTITVHHPEYYQGAGPPADWDSPTPIATLSAAGSFLFAVEGSPSARKHALRLLGGALRDEGIGARTLKGYGRFDVSTGDDVVPAPSTRPRLLWLGGPEAPYGVSRPPDAPGALTPPPAGPQTHVAEQATLRYQPNTKCFEVTVTHQGRSLKGTTEPSPIDLFAGETDDARRASMEALHARCRKKGAATVRVRYEVLGNRVIVKSIEAP
jgi:CRISPR/Cas system CMR subunit Cmr6 (Cas7 group RAMP superfamily)